MRDLREAIKQGPWAALISASYLPRRHPATFAMALGGIAIVLLALGYVDTRRDVNVIQPKVTQIIESAAACQKGATRLDLRICVRRIEIALGRCRQSAACRSKFQSLIRAVRDQPSHSGRARKGVVAGSGNSPSGQPSPGSQPGDKGRSKAPNAAPHPHHPGSSEPPAPVAPGSEPATALPPAPDPPQPGNSGDTPAPDRGVKACVKLIVSACVKTDLRPEDG